MITLDADTVTTPLVEPLELGFTLDDAHVAHEPPEDRGVARDQVRLLVSPGTEAPVHARFADLPDLLAPGDLLVVNNSATLPAAIDAELEPTGATAEDDARRPGRRIVVHVSTELPGGLWMVEPRQPVPGGATSPLALAPTAWRVRLGDGTVLDLLRPAAGSRRLWLAAPVDDDGDVRAALAAAGRPIRYRYVPEDHPLDRYQTVFAVEPGSAEMPSAARPFTPELVARLVGRGIGFATVTLHTGVSSLEGHELPYPERFAVPAATAAAVAATRAIGGHVVAVGTTAVRALESAVDAGGTVHPASGWTDVVVTPARGVRAVDGLISGWHEPEATHLAMLEAVAGRDALRTAYGEAWRHGYLWHEFGDSHLLLPYAGSS